MKSFVKGGMPAAIAGVGLGAVGLGITAARGAVVYSNGGLPTTVQYAAALSSAMQAQAFSLAAAREVGGLTFYGLENPRGTPGFSGSVYWSIRRDNGGVPASAEVAGEVTTAVSRSVAGEPQNNFHLAVPELFTVGFATPVALDPGNYWLVLHNGPLSAAPEDLSGHFFLWAAVSSSTGGSLGAEDDAPFEGTWVTGGGERLFSLVSVVPEPEGAGWVGVVGGGLLLRRRRR